MPFEVFQRSGWIEFSKWAESLGDEYPAVSEFGASMAYDDAAELLEELRDAVEAEKPKHPTSQVAKILIENLDAESGAVEVNDGEVDDDHGDEDDMAWIKGGEA